METQRGQETVLLIDIARDIMCPVGLRVVLDTSFVVAALRSDKGASRVLLTSAMEKRFSLILSVPLMLEYEAVLTRPEHLEVAGISRDEVQVLLDAIAEVATPVRLAYLWRPTLKDAQDDMVLETAVNGEADLLVTLNRQHFEPAVTFGVKVVGPGDALAQLRRTR